MNGLFFPLSNSLHRPTARQYECLYFARFIRTLKRILVIEILLTKFPPLKDLPGHSCLAHVDASQRIMNCKSLIVRFAGSSPSQRSLCDNISDPPESVSHAIDNNFIVLSCLKLDFICLFYPLHDISELLDHCTLKLISCGQLPADRAWPCLRKSELWVSSRIPQMLFYICIGITDSTIIVCLCHQSISHNPCQIQGE